MAEFCFKRHPTTAVKCTKGGGHGGDHAFGDRLHWTDGEAQQTLSIMAAAYGGIVSWPPEGPGARKLPCKRCKKQEVLRECPACGVNLCHECMFTETCAHGVMGQHSVLVEKPM